jgi:hypothetical protein
MADSFEEMLKNRKKLAKQAEEKVQSLKKNSYDDDTKDERFWEMSHLKNEDGLGRATFRFLPAPKGEEINFALYYAYFQKSPYNNKWFVHNSRMSFGEPAESDPAYQYNGKIYSDNSLDKDQKKKLSIRRQKKFVTNILMIDDPVEPSNNGKVFLFEYGPMIHKLIENRMNPDPAVDDYKKAIPSDPIDGCNFKLKIVSKLIDGRLVPNYEQSTWEDVAPITDDMDKLKEIWQKAYPLKPFNDPENTTLFSSVEKQKADLAQWLGEEAPQKEKEAPKPKEEAPVDKSPSLDEDDDDLPFDLDEKESKASILDDDDDDDFFDKFK